MSTYIVDFLYITSKIMLGQYKFEDIISKYNIKNTNAFTFKCGDDIKKLLMSYIDINNYVDNYEKKDPNAKFLYGIVLINLNKVNITANVNIIIKYFSKNVKSNLYPNTLHECPYKSLLIRNKFKHIDDYLAYKVGAAINNHIRKLYVCFEYDLNKKCISNVYAFNVTFTKPVEIDTLLNDYSYNAEHIKDKYNHLTNNFMDYVYIKTMGSIVEDKSFNATEDVYTLYDSLSTVKNTFNGKDKVDDGCIKLCKFNIKCKVENDKRSYEICSANFENTPYNFNMINYYKRNKQYNVMAGYYIDVMAAKLIKIRNVKDISFNLVTIYNKGFVCIIDIEDFLVKSIANNFNSIKDTSNKLSFKGVQRSGAKEIMITNADSTSHDTIQPTFTVSSAPDTPDMPTTEDTSKEDIKEDTSKEDIDDNDYNDISDAYKDDITMETTVNDTKVSIKVDIQGKHKPSDAFYAYLNDRIKELIEYVDTHCNSADSNDSNSNTNNDNDEDDVNEDEEYVI